MKIRAKHLILLAISMAALAPLAGAKSTFFSSFLKLTGLESSKTYKDAGCSVCHTSPSGGESWNSFGQEMLEAYGKSRRDFGKALYAVLSSNKDADGDGYSDVLEVFAGTLPADKTSKPTKSLKDLQAEFAKAGGVDKYKPKN